MIKHIYILSIGFSLIGIFAPVTVGFEISNRGRLQELDQKLDDFGVDNSATKDAIVSI